jgi:predicted acetyltransferase/precorrin-6B methylase 2
MPQLIAPDGRFRRSFAEAMDEFRAEGRGTADDRTVIGRYLREQSGAVASDEAFEAFAAGIRAQRLEETPRPEGFVPDTELWWIEGEEFLGRIGVRHRLTPALLEMGGHIGYDVRPTARRRGHATQMLRQALPFARALGIDPALVTCDVDNVGSRAVIERNGGVLEDQRGDKLRFWVPAARLPYDPTIYRGSAEHYAIGRPPYSAELRPTLVRELGLDGSGRLLDVGCGPGVVARELAPAFAGVVGLDPDPDMLRVAARLAAAQGISNATWVQAVAEDLAGLGLGSFTTVTFGQSLHWTDRTAVVDSVFELLEPGGSIVLIAPEVEGRPIPPGPDLPAIPQDAVKALVAGYLGSVRRAGQGTVRPPGDRYAQVLARSRFGGSRSLFAPGRPDIVRSVDEVISNFLSMSWCAPHLFGDRLESFIAELRALLEAGSPTGRYHDWPGDTEMVIGTKPR